MIYAAMSVGQTALSKANIDVSRFMHDGHICEAVCQAIK